MVGKLFENPARSEKLRKVKLDHGYEVKGMEPSLIFLFGGIRWPLLYKYSVPRYM